MRSIEIPKYIGNGNRVVIPKNIADKPVTSPGDSAFMLSAITAVIMPDTVIYIGAGTFERCDHLAEVKETLNKSRLAARHIACLHLFRQSVQIPLAIGQLLPREFVRSDEKSDGASNVPDLISASLN